MRTVVVIMSGRVQGVWFRDWTQKKARALGLSGWVRNRRDGDVEALLAGPAEDVETMIDKCRSGSPLSRVDGVQISEADGFEGEDFEIRPTE